jgi:hypothetical protein
MAKLVEYPSENPRTGAPAVPTFWASLIESLRSVTVRPDAGAVVSGIDASSYPDRSRLHPDRPKISIGPFLPSVAFQINWLEGQIRGNALIHCESSLYQHRLIGNAIA